MQRRSARGNPASPGGIVLTLVGFGIVAFSAFELFTGGRGFVPAAASGASVRTKTRPAPPKLLPHAPARPVPPPSPVARTAPVNPLATPRSGGGFKPPTQQQVQQAVQAGQAIVSGAESLFGGASPSDTRSADTSSSMDNLSDDTGGGS
jgi:hypothetical protein